MSDTMNPIGTDGFEFLEFTSPKPEELEKLFLQLGMTAVGKHKSKDIIHFKQNDVNFILNRQPNSQAADFAGVHGPSINAMAFRVKDAEFAINEAVKRGATRVQGKVGPMELEIPAIEGIGGLHIYLVDTYGAETIYDTDFDPIEGANEAANEAKLDYIDHVTHNVYRGNMDKWAEFYENVFNFKEIRYFDIEGKLTGLLSKAMTSPCGKIRIPINESQDDKSQIEEFLHHYNGEGIQHIALASSDIYSSVDKLRGNDVPFQSTPDTYFDKIDERVEGHGENVEELRKRHILVDGAPTEGAGILLQIFTQETIGPAFFELIQRKGNEGFGEGNFKALFESIEEDQIRRGVLEGAAS